MEKLKPYIFPAIWTLLFVWLFLSTFLQRGSLKKALDYPGHPQSTLYQEYKLTEGRQLTDQELVVFYRGYNETYFEDKLPNVPIFYDDTIAAKYEMAETSCTDEMDNTTCKILISSASRPWPRVVLEAILHEQCHVALMGKPDLNEEGLQDDHGPKWMKCMHRLVNANAMDPLF